jgi:cupin fold WbuC family metalloprotein
MILIDRPLLDRLTVEAITSPRKRKNYNFHEVFSDPINRMLNALEPGTYVQPHKHENPDKREIFIGLRGSFVLFYFDDAGVVTEYALISQESGCYGVEVEPRRWHSIVSLESGSVFYEIKDGPYEANNDKNMAPWAPREGDATADDYLAALLKIAKLE